MTAQAAAEPALGKRSQPGSLRAIFLAICVHAAFFALIVFGVSWQSKPSPPVEVELWDKLPPAKTAAPPEPPRPAEPPPEPAKPVEMKPPPPPPEKKPEEVKPEKPNPDAEIAQRRARAKAEMEKREKEKRERVEKQREAEAKKKREEDEARAKAEAEKKKREDDKRRREDVARKEAEKAAQVAATARQAETDRFVNAIKAKIRGRANVPDTVKGNPEVHVLIHLLPGGEVLDIRITRASGNPAYDSAIERGIRSASPLPVPPANSELFPQFRELNLLIRHER